jgi:hypothetical protein
MKDGGGGEAEAATHGVRGSCCCPIFQLSSKPQGRFPQIPNRAVRRGAQRLGRGVTLRSRWPHRLCIGSSVTLRSKTSNPKYAMELLQVALAIVPQPLSLGPDQKEGKAIWADTTGVSALRAEAPPPSTREIQHRAPAEAHRGGFMADTRPTHEQVHAQSQMERRCISPMCGGTSYLGGPSELRHEIQGPKRHPQESSQSTWPVS